jgi:hypothetical protein
MSADKWEISILDLMRHFAMRTLLSLPILLVSALSNAFVQAKPVQESIFCAAPKTGQYLMMSQGLRGNQPMGSLQLETWLPNGSVTGTRFLRVGRTYSETKYEGRWELESNCGLTVTRDEPGYESKILLTAQGLPRFGLSNRTGDVVREQWMPQPDRSCEPESMNGSFLSQQRGSTFAVSSWKPNAVIQRESWSGWRMVGLAVSSYDGAGEVAGYHGQFTQKENCVGRIRQQDDRGVTYDYVAILRSDGSGYAYLQTQGDDLTVALVEKSG